MSGNDREKDKNDKGKNAVDPYKKRENLQNGENHSSDIAALMKRKGDKDDKKSD